MPVNHTIGSEGVINKILATVFIITPVKKQTIWFFQYQLTLEIYIVFCSTSVLLFTIRTHAWKIKSGRILTFSYISVSYSVDSNSIGGLTWTQIARFMGSTWGPPGSCRPQMGPMSAPWTLLSGKRDVRSLIANVEAAVVPIGSLYHTSAWTDPELYMALMDR